MNLRDGGDLPFHETLPTVVLTGIGPSLHQIDVRDGFSVESRGVNGIIQLPGDEVSIRMGLPGTLTGVTADDYPGIGERDATLDGRFVRVSVVMTAVPEPGAATLLGAGLLAFAARSRLRHSLRSA